MLSPSTTLNEHCRGWKWFLRKSSWTSFQLKNTVIKKVTTVRWKGVRFKKVRASYLSDRGNDWYPTSNCCFFEGTAQGTRHKAKFEFGNWKLGTRLKGGVRRTNSKLKYHNAKFAIRNSKLPPYAPCALLYAIWPDSEDQSLDVQQKKRRSLWPPLILNVGGADRDRTDDLLNAIQALSQTELQPQPL